MSNSVHQACAARHSKRKSRRSILLASSALGLMSAFSVATAQETVEADQAEGELVQDDIIVKGIRGSLQSALNEKRNAENLIEVILAEDIGKLPDQNLAEVLENVTGIQITREAGVGTGVQIRGADENRIEINGVTTVGSGTGRTGIDFEDVAAAIIAGVEVIKAPEAGTIEGAVGGTINLRTIRPLDLDEDDFLANLRLQGENSSLSNDGIQLRADGTIGKKWSNNSGQEIGSVISLSYTKQDTTAFRPRADADNDSVVDANRNNPGTTAFNYLPPQFFVQDLDNFEAENLNIAATIEARLVNNMKLYFDAVVNRQRRFQESSRIQASGISNSETGLNVDNFSAFETVDFGSLNGQQIGTIERATKGIVPVQADGTDGNLRFSSDTGSRVTNSEILRLGTEWEINDRLSAKIEGSYSNSGTVTPTFNTTLNFINPNIDLDAAQLRANFFAGMGVDSNENGTPFEFDVTGGSLTFGILQDPALFGPTTAQLLDPANVLLRDVQQGFNETNNREIAFRSDFSYDLQDTFSGDFITSVDAGYRYNETTSNFDDIDSNVGFRGIEQSPFGDLFSGLLVPGPNNFDSGDGRALFVSDFLVIDPELVADDPAGVLAILNAAILENNALFGFNGNTIDSPTSNQASFFDIGEKTHSVYGQVNFEHGIFRGNAGVRYVNTNVTSTGNTIINGEATLTSVQGSYSFWLPRFNLAVNPTDDIIVRGSWSRDIRRPDFGDLSTSFTFSTSPNPPVSVGNPGLEPQEIQSFDLGVEWYFAPAAVVSIGYFRKERKGLFVAVQEEPATTATPIVLPDGTMSSVDVRDITAPCEGGGIFNPIADQNVFAPVDATGNQLNGVGVCVPISQVINDTGQTNQQGIEVVFQYDLSEFEDRLGWASGFGFIANYTYQNFSGTETVLKPTSRARDIFEGSNPGATDVEFTTTLLNNSDNSYNITLFYEKYGVSARARYTWRSSFRSDDFGSTSSFPFGFPVFQEARGQLNASINYAVTEHLNVGVDAVNLTMSNVTQRCVNSDGPVCFQGLTDRRIQFGANYRF